ncbi:MAG TPA: FAD-binding oxidoreductase [Candidatus Limnocylindrales bacterium]|nr:FAD-binding oxidoreductase [Candidatus Limnocylindrales bacterium]
MRVPAAAQPVIDALRDRITGRVVTPDDPEYDAMRTIMIGGIDPRPAAIVRVSGPADVAAALATAREAGLAIAVRSGGHSGAGHSSVDDGVVIDLRDLKAIEIDAAGRTAWVETGLTAGEVTTAVGEHGLAIGFGDTGSVGVGGITSGGGIGYLVRKHGLTIDNVLAAEVVLADGRCVTADAATHPDLFWAIRGGAGNVGIVTRFRFRLHELGKIHGGFLVLPATPETVAGFIAAAEAAPETVSTILNVMPAPPMPGLPEAVVNQMVIFAMIVSSGDPADGEAAVAPFRALAEPHLDLLREMSYAEMFPPEEAGYHPKVVGETLFLDRIDLEAAAIVMRNLQASDAPFRFIQARVLGGAMARIPADATAFAHRSARIMAVCGAFFETPEEGATRRAWVERFVAELDQGVPGAYVNFVDDAGEASARRAYPGPTWDRLAAVKARYDPTNLFRRNHNVPPATMPVGAEA